jgi:hypothetical protein
VFVGAHAHVSEWPSRFWHTGIRSRRSSQGLCVSVWGTLANDRRRTKILDAIFGLAGVRLAKVSAPRITGEAVPTAALPRYSMREEGTPRRHVSTLSSSGREVSSVSRANSRSQRSANAAKLRRGLTTLPVHRSKKSRCPQHVTAAMARGSDRKTLSNAPCRLQVWDGDRAPRLYWQIGWDIFRPEVLRPDGRPCPFAGPSFQLMRNLALACAAAAPRSSRSSVTTA